jgi:two-component system NarL family sensor kinase
MVPVKLVTHPTESRWSTFWLIVVLFTIVGLLEYSTPPEYVFGYLYTGPILLANPRLSRLATVRVTILACALTILNIWFPGFESVSASTIASRFIAILALIIMGILSDRNRLYQEVLMQQAAKLHTQEKLASVREDFASTLTHDLKTPILGAIETLQAFQRENFGPVVPVQKEVLATMIRSHQNSLQMVETLLDVYRNDIEGLKLHLAPVNLVEIAEEVAVTLNGLASSRRVHIIVHYGESDFRKYLWVHGDAFQLQRVFANLLTNAINHSPRGGKVGVVLEPGSSYHTVKVMDNGAGIQPEELPHLFERFYQGNSNRQAKGSGLGLYLSRQIIEAHGGTIWAENIPVAVDASSKVFKGAIFGFKLPIYLHKTSLS